MARKAGEGISGSPSPRHSRHRWLRTSELHEERPLALLPKPPKGAAVRTEATANPPLTHRSMTQRVVGYRPVSIRVLIDSAPVRCPAMARWSDGADPIDSARSLCALALLLRVRVIWVSIRQMDHAADRPATLHDRGRVPKQPGQIAAATRRQGLGGTNRSSGAAFGPRNTANECHRIGRGRRITRRPQGNRTEQQDRSHAFAPRYHATKRGMPSAMGTRGW